MGAGGCGCGARAAGGDGRGSGPRAAGACGLGARAAGICGGGACGRAAAGGATCSRGAACGVTRSFGAALFGSPGAARRGSGFRFGVDGAAPVVPDRWPGPRTAGDCGAGGETCAPPRSRCGPGARRSPPRFGCAAEGACPVVADGARGGFWTPPRSFGTPPRSRCCAPCPRRSSRRFGCGPGCAAPWPVVADGARCGVCAAGDCCGGMAFGPRRSGGRVDCAAGGDVGAGAAPVVPTAPRAARGGLSPSRPFAPRASGCGGGTLRVGRIMLLVC